MQFIILIAVVAAIAALSVGYLTNDIPLSVQQFGVGENDIESPVTQAALTIHILRFTGLTLDGNTVVTGHKDFIVECSFASTDKTLFTGTKIFCKLLDGMFLATANIIAEGNTMLVSDVPAGASVIIPIQQTSNENSNNVNFVHNVVIVIQDPPQ